MVRVDETEAIITRALELGVNFIDTYFREGMYPSPVGLPFVAGNELSLIHI